MSGEGPSRSGHSTNLSNAFLPSTATMTLNRRRPNRFYLRDSEDNRYPNASAEDDELVLCDYGLDTIPLRYQVEFVDYHPHNITHLNLSQNAFIELSGIGTFVNVVTLDVSNNSLTSLPEEIGHLTQLRTLIARNNLLESLPKSMCTMSDIENIYLSGNRMDSFPTVVLGMMNLRVLHMGGNLLEALPYAIGTLKSLEILYLGGNRLQDVPATIGHLESLTSLALCDNILETIPSTLGDLDHLESLSLHNNRLKTLPTEIIKLQNLQQLSLRNNPLVHSFVHNINIEPPTLRELAGRVVRLKMHKMPIRDVLPRELVAYLNSACQCVNPNCKGVYFDARVEHVKFVDFCGKYRVPLLQFLCSPKCTSGAPAVTYDSSSESEEEYFEPRMRKVLLG